MGEEADKGQRATKQTSVRGKNETSARRNSRQSSDPDPGPALPASALLKDRLEGTIEVATSSGAITLTHLEKIYWPESGFTKGDLIRYYHTVAQTILPYLNHRPIILKRFPGGISEGSFFQHDAGDVPEFVPTVRLETEEGRNIDYILCDNEATLLYLSNLGAIERHPWHSRTEHLDRPDWIVFDLDPGEGVAFEQICELALATRDVLDRFGLMSCAKTSGSRGMHVYVPIASRYSFDETASLAARVAAVITRENPAVATLERSVVQREADQIYVDHLQNARGKAVAAPYSVRPRPGATVSTPLSWADVKSGVDPRDFSIVTVPQRLKKRGDLFRPVLENKQALENAIKEAERLP